MNHPVVHVILISLVAFLIIVGMGETPAAKKRAERQWEYCLESMKRGDNNHQCNKIFGRQDD